MATLLCLALTASMVVLLPSSPAATPGTQASDDLAPASRVGALPAMHNNHALKVPVNVTAGSGDLDHLKLYYRVNGAGNFALYTTAGNPKGEWHGNPITFVTASDGRYEFFSLATNRSGSTEPIKNASEATVLIDTVRPSSSASVTGDWGNAGWYRAPAKVNLTAADALSGAAAIYYRVDGGGFKLYSGQFMVDGDGYHKLEHYAKDKAGNAEAVRSADIRVDRNGPSVDFEKRSGSNFGSGDLEVKLKIVDEASGVDMAQVSLDGGRFQNIPLGDPKASFSGLEEGTHTMVVRAWDYAGNMAESSWSFNVDRSSLSRNVAPVIIPLGAVGITLLSLAAIFFVSRRGR